MKPTYVYNAALVKVVDGDTLVVQFDLGFHVSTTERLRLLGINAPEVSTPEGIVSRDYLRAKMPTGSQLVVTTFKDPGDKYGRWLANVSFKGTDINKLMVSTGHAVPFMV